MGVGSVGYYLQHEVGHHVQWEVLDAKTNNLIGSRMNEYASKVSGYATATKGEYIAESFSAYVKGQRSILDPEFVSFMEGKRLDNFGKSGIIKSEGMYRKYDSGKFVPMPNGQFIRIKKRFKALGGVIQQNDETDVYLIKKHVEGITYNENTILLMKKPSRASVFEELIHTAQYRDGKIGDTRKSRVMCEIEAQKKLLKHAKAYILTTREIEQTQRALESYEKELEQIIKSEV